jgi:predicted dehydrogenase
MKQEEYGESSYEVSIEPARKSPFKRRDFLKGFASIPVFGAFLLSYWRKKVSDDKKKKAIIEELGLTETAPEVAPKAIPKKPQQLIRLGIIGFGGRGEYLAMAAGFVSHDLVTRKKQEEQENKLDKELETFMSQEHLHVVLNGICDVYDARARRGLAASKFNKASGQFLWDLPEAKRYRTYQELLASPDIDAVIIATPDHWHAQMVINAVNAGKHVYCEKCMTRTPEEAVKVFEAVKKRGVVFQLGHQNRQQESHLKAKFIVQKNILGKVTLVETTTNRNSPDGAWVYEIPEDASPENIDWEQFQGPAPHKVPFSKERIFRWRCWYDYGTGLAGDLLSHEYDAANQILELGIPKTAVASGGIYFFKDGRDVPDVFQAAFEYPDRELTLVYSATLASDRSRGRIFMGHDASMEIGETLTVMADSESTRYKDKIEKGIIDTSLPLLTYQPGAKGINTIISAREKYLASRSLMYSYNSRERYDATHLHIKEWLDCIRNGGEPSCNVDRGFEEAITCHMATQSYLRGRKVEWDPVNRKIV